MEQVQLRNLSNQAKTVYISGKPVTLPPYAEDFYDVTIARVFLAEHSPLIEKVDLNATTVVTPDSRPTTGWVANMTGLTTEYSPTNPYTLPLKIRVPYYNKITKLKEMAETDHPRRTAKTLIIKKMGADEIYLDQYGQGQSRTLPTTKIIIPPFRRIELPLLDVEWILTRDSQRSEWERGEVIRSRAPTNFEPDMTWDLDLIRSYLHWCVPTATAKDLGPTLAKVKKEHTGGAVEKEVNRYKAELMRKLYPIRVNPDVRLPTQAELNEFISGKPEGLSDQAVSNLVKQAWDATGTGT